MSQQIIAAIQYHRVLGYIIKPYLADYKPEMEVWKIRNSITAEDVSGNEYGDAASRVVKLSGAYSDTEILRRFARSSKHKAKSIRNFYDSVTEAYAQEHIRPFVQRKILEIIRELQNADIPVLMKEKQGVNQQVSERIHVKPGFAQTLFHFRHTAEGIHYSMQFRYNGTVTKLKNRSHFFLSWDPCVVVIDQVLYAFRDIDGKKLKPFFTKDHILVPARLKEQYFHGFVKKVVRDCEVIAEGFEVNKQHPDPAWKLALTKDMANNLSLELLFDYGSEQVFPDNEATNLVKLYSKGDTVRYEKIYRNFHSERKAQELLVNYRLRKTYEIFFNFRDDDPEGTKLITWLNRHAADLSENGFTITRSDDVPSYFIGAVQLVTTIREEKNDWFDVYAVVRAGRFEIPFMKMRRHILKGERYYQLPDGTWFVIPEEWFEQYSDLMTYAREGDESVMMVQKHHYSLLMDAGIEHDTKIPDSLKQLYTDTAEKAIAPPPRLKAQLRPYQKEGFAWLYHLHQHGFGGCLADDMGLGKTVQALALLLKAAYEEEGDSTSVAPNPSGKQLTMFQEVTGELSHAQTSLIIMPTSLLHNWEAEIAKFAPHLKVLVYRGKREGLIEKFPEYDIVLSSYGVARIDSAALSEFHFFYIILDESQYVKNPGSKTYKAINSMVSEHRMVLTGTPIENSLTDLWAQLNFLNAGLLGAYSNFIEKFVTPIERKKDEALEDKLNHIIRPFLLRRKKSDVARELPPLSEQVYYCEMTEAQHETYERYKSGIRNSLIDNLLDDELPEHRMQVLEALLRMRQMANHPVLADEDYEGDSGKFNEVVRTIESLMAEGNKAIFFSSFVGHLNLISEYLKKQGYSHAMLTGKTRQRQEEVRRFQEDSDVKIFLVSLKAGGTGLNLTAAEYVFILDPWWNPAAEQQALNRAHRIGQDKNVFVYRLISRGSIEEKIYKLQERKSKLAETFINTNDPFRNMTAGQIQELFR